MPSSHCGSRTVWLRRHLLIGNAGVVACFSTAAEIALDVCPFSYSLQSASATQAAAMAAPLTLDVSQFENQTSRPLLLQLQHCS